MKLFRQSVPKNFIDNRVHCTTCSRRQKNFRKLLKQGQLQIQTEVQNFLKCHHFDTSMAGKSTADPNNQRSLLQHLVIQHRITQWHNSISWSPLAHAAWSSQISAAQYKSMHSKNSTDTTAKRGIHQISQACCSSTTTLWGVGFWWNQCHLTIWKDHPPGP